MLECLFVCIIWWFLPLWTDLVRCSYTTTLKWFSRNHFSGLHHVYFDSCQINVLIFTPLNTVMAYNYSSSAVSSLINHIFCPCINYMSQTVHTVELSLWSFTGCSVISWLSASTCTSPSTATKFHLHKKCHTCGLHTSSAIQLLSSLHQHPLLESGTRQSWHCDIIIQG